MIPLSGCQQWPHDNPAIPVGDHDSDAALTPLHGTRSSALHCIDEISVLLGVQDKQQLAKPAAA
jgi:hypothetical protein